MPPLEALLARDRQIIVVALASVTLLSWGYLLAGAGMSMPSGGSMMMMPMQSWTPGFAALVFLMWWIMMIAMMLPSAAPAILLFARVNAQMRDAGKAFVPAAYFALGYLAVWGVFSALATFAQWWLERAGLLSGMMASTSTALNAALLIAAGLWQLTPIKHACLRHCRGPMHFFTGGFRRGTGGALRMGAEHGLFCLGCCWFLMALLFFGGVMSFVWIGGIALYVLIEKLAPAGDRVGNIAGVALIGWGGWLIIAPA
ncbi:DUF2182 domain-containing protein [Limibaculum sp. M0105]|uniref:DUF2182 domain-containing protein n=1 Tax=Thermohalobaculum xanthum TaxID=2753746 RepID=A0A8J7M7H5_9RHOB|nr:DUF2182 domain-containing protein [Thermohalobaculum xanthum]MBK0399779.1 DUF2182 domain-containing protein [Thermohalobaculum xanthum]